MEQQQKTIERDYLPILQFVSILSDKGIRTSVDVIANAMANGCFDALKDEKGEWHCARHEMLRRIKEHGRKVPPIEEGYVSVDTYVYLLWKEGIHTSASQVSTQILYGLLVPKEDKIGRLLISKGDLQKRIEQGILQMI